MKNFELKAIRTSNSGTDFLKKFSVEVLRQKDTYYETTDGRLKLRQEKNWTTGERRAYFVRYDRSDKAEERISDYDFYLVDDVELFKKVFGGALKTEVIVKKTRELSLYKNARIHVDTVEGLDLPFIEIEVVIRRKEEDENAPRVMEELIEILQIKPEDKMGLGYRELLLK